MTARKPTLTGPHSKGAHSATPHHLLRLLVVVGSLFACSWGVWNSGREGLAQLLTSYGAAANRLDAADRAAQLGAAVPEAHFVRAGLLSDRGARAEAAEEYERAVALRPHDYALWLELGRARDQLNDQAGALAAFSEAVRLAPFYAAPRWQLGNTLYHAGRLEEAFAELRRAVASEPRLMPQALGLAWVAFGGDARSIEQSLQPQTSSLQLAMARFFVKHGKTREALAQFHRAGGASDAERRALLEELLAAKRFAEAYEVWSSAHQTAEGASAANALVLNGGFEAPVILNDPGFGWQLPQNLPAVQAAQDRAEPRTGAQSLRLVWSGNSDAASALLSQLILVEPGARYQIHFAARTEKLVTGGPPLISVMDAGGDDARMLGAAAVTLPQGTSPWRDYSIEFTTAKTTAAVRLIVRRQSCTTAPCPVFGRAWLDDFSIVRLSEAAR